MLRKMHLGLVGLVLVGSVSVFGGSRSHASRQVLMQYMQDIQRYTNGTSSNPFTDENGQTILNRFVDLSDIKVKHLEKYANHAMNLMGVNGGDAEYATFIFLFKKDKSGKTPIDYAHEKSTAASLKGKNDMLDKLQKMPKALLTEDQKEALAKYRRI